MFTADYWIEKLQLKSHPEGGFYRETYRAPLSINANGFDGARASSTAIYFLLRSEDRSALHRIKSDEIWHFYAGGSLTLTVLQRNKYDQMTLGSNAAAGHSLQLVVPAGAWFGGKVNEPNSYVLAGCTVSPGFDFRDSEMAERSKLLQAFPEHKLIIEALT